MSSIAADTGAQLSMMKDAYFSLSEKDPDHELLNFDRVT